MSTRGLIGKIDADGIAIFRYHHFDSYPDGLGKSLYDLYNGFFRRDLQGMKRVLLDEHCAWSSIIAADFSLSPGFSSWDSKRYPNYNDYEQSSSGKRPHCYCHGERSEGPYDFITQDNARTWAEYAYVLDTSPDGDVLFCCTRQSFPHDDRVRRRQFGVWSTFAIVPLDGPEPDWERLEPSNEEEED